MPSTETGRSAAVHDTLPYRRTSTYMCVHDTIAATTARAITLRVVVHRIARSGPPSFAFPTADQPSASSTREATSSGTTPSGSTTGRQLVSLRPRTRTNRT
jgi:hypothetical protein